MPLMLTESLTSQSSGAISAIALAALIKALAGICRLVRLLFTRNVVAKRTIHRFGIRE